VPIVNIKKIQKSKQTFFEIVSLSFLR